MSKAWIYFYNDFSEPDESFIKENIRSLPLFRQEKCARYRHNSDKRACIISYQLLVKGLREQFGLATGGEFVYNKHGKPYLSDYPHIFFNLSHCKSGVVCALADVEVGIDIQDVRPYDTDLARRVCSENELRVLSESDEPAKQFCRIWTYKESYAKAEGISVFAVLRQDLPGGRAAYQETGEYCMTLCGKGVQEEIMCQIIQSH